MDALATLRPDALRRICQEAVEPFYDDTLEERTNEARERWTSGYQALLDGQVDDGMLAELRAQAEAKLEDVRAEIDVINEQIRAATDTVGFDYVPPDPVPHDLPEGLKGKPIISSGWPWVDQTRALQARKAYGSGEAEP